MKKPILIIFLSLLYLSACDIGWGPPDCTYKESFNNKGDVPDIKLAISDSVVIDMSKYYQAKVSCDTYTPIIKQAKGNKDLIEIRSIDEFLILKGIQKGKTEIEVVVEKRNATFDTADCHTFSTSAEPIFFTVTIDEATDFDSDKIVTDVNNRILSFKITPSSFSKGDTVLVEFEATKSQVAWSTWFSESGTFISDESLRSDCQDGYVVANSRQVEMIVETNDSFIEGYAHIDFAKIQTDKTGTYFHISSEDEPANIYMASNVNRQYEFYARKNSSCLSDFDRCFVELYYRLFSTAG